MKMRLLAGIAALTMTSVAAFTAAQAADMYRPHEGVSLKDAYYPATWTGFYLGVNGGYGWSAYSDQYAWPSAHDDYGTLNASGGFGGGQIGYNWQGSGPLVLGVEADIQASGISDSDTTCVDLGCKTQLDWFGTVRGRLGYATGNTLLYFTGGLAFGGLENTVGDGVYYSKVDGTATGYVLGGGLEHKFSPSWSIKAEYQFLNFGKNEMEHEGKSFSSYGVKFEEDAYHTARVGLNYHLQPASEPLK